MTSQRSVWLKKIVKNTTITLVSFSVILLSLIYILLGTDKGFQSLLDTASDVTDRAFKYEKVTGNFFSRLRLNQVFYHDTEMEVAVNQVDFDWQASQLFHAKVLVNYLLADGITFKQLSTNASVETESDIKTSEPLKLPEVILPIDIFLKELQLTDISIQTVASSEAQSTPESALENQPINISQITLKADLIRGKIDLHRLALEMPEMNARINGKMALTQDYPLSLQNNITLNIPAQSDSKASEISIVGTIKGNLKTLKLAQETSGLLNSSINASATELLADLVWQADIIISQLSLNTFMPGQKEFITVNLNSHGDLSRADTRIMANVLNNTLKNEQLNSKKTEGTQIDIDTQFIFAEQKFKAKAQWQRLQWPLSGLAKFTSDTGLLQVNGTPEDYTMNLQFALSGSDIPKGDWHADAQGNLTQIHISSLQGKTLNGIIDAQSKVSWLDAIEWQAALQTNKIDPGKFLEQWPGSLNINLTTSGKISDESLTANLKLEQLSGNLREQPIAGGGEFDFFSGNKKGKEKISIKHLNLSSGEAKLKANGILGMNINEQVALDWSLSIARLSELLPDAKGSISGQGHITGTIEIPQIKADLKLNKIDYLDTQIKDAELHSDLNFNPAIPSKLNLNIHTMMISSATDASQVIEQVKVALDGPLNQHRLTVFIDHEMAKLNLATTGKFDIAQLSWGGNINKLSLNSSDFGHWQQKQSSQFYTSATKVTLSNLCLNEQESSLCAILNWTPDKGSATIHLSKLSFERAKPFLPQEIKEFSGSVDLQAKMNLAPTLQAHITTEIKPGTISYQPINKKTIALNHKNGLIEARYSAKQLLAQWNIELGPHKINGDINIPRSAIEKEPMTAPIQGNIGIDIKDLNIISLIAPQITEINGHLLSQLQLGGYLNEPRVTGSAELIASSIGIRDLGTRFTDLKVHIEDRSNGEILTLNGGLKSEQGALVLDGQVALDAVQGFPIEIKIKGDNFLAINIPDAYGIISPDIHFSQNKGLMDIKGKLYIPEASIAPSSIPEGSISPSPDVIILGEEKQTPPNMNLDVTIELGDKVHLRAFGLKTDLEGEMTVTQKPKQLMIAHGELRLENGTFRAYGQDLTIDEGSVFYAGGYLDNPGLKFSASRRVKETQVGIKVSGTAKKPNLDTFSDDTSLTDKDIVSLMLTGQKTDNLENARIYAGTDINDKLSVGVNAGMGDEGSEFVTRYRLTEKVQLEGTSSSAKSGGSVLYTFEID